MSALRVPGAESAVEPARAEAAALEQELQRRHVPAALTAVHHAGAQPRAAATARALAGLRARYAIDPQTPMLLERADSTLCDRALHAVDRDGVKADCLECDLKSGDVGAARNRLLRRAQRKRDCEYDHAGYLPDVTHAFGFGASLRTGKQRKRSCMRLVAGEPVAHARLGDQIARMGRVGLELAAQLGHVDAQVVGLGLVAPAPRPPAAAGAARTSLPSLRISTSSTCHSVGVRRTGVAVASARLLGGEVDREVPRSRRPARPRRSRCGAARPAGARAARPSRTASSRSRRRRRRARRPCRPAPARAESTMIGARVQPRSPSITSTPSMSGSPRSSTTTSGGCARGRSAAPSARPRPRSTS